MNASRTTITSRRAVGALFLSGVALVATIATAAAFNGRDAGTDTPPASPSPIATPIPMPDPSDPPVITPAPAEPSAPAETPETPEPTDGGGDAMPIKVDLENVTGADVYVDIVDGSGTVVDAESGTPGDGMSVEPWTLQVENIDARTLRLTWVDFPIDNALALYIDEDASRFVLVQPEPSSATDAVGFDRELILTFDHDISAAEVETFLQDGLDTPGE
jgi:hypothetical protein